MQTVSAGMQSLVLQVGVFDLSTVVSFSHFNQQRLPDGSAHVPYLDSRIEAYADRGQTDGRTDGQITHGHPYKLYKHFSKCSVRSSFFPNVSSIYGTAYLLIVLVLPLCLHSRIR